MVLHNTLYCFGVLNKVYGARSDHIWKTQTSVDNGLNGGNNCSMKLWLEMADIRRKV